MINCEPTLTFNCVTYDQLMSVGGQKETQICLNEVEVSQVTSWFINVDCRNLTKRLTASLFQCNCILDNPLTDRYFVNFI